MQHLENYSCAGDRSISFLETQVNGLLEAGYIPIGGPFVKDEMVWQAMAKPVEQFPPSDLKTTTEYTENTWGGHSILPEDNEWAKDIADGKTESKAQD